MPIYMTAKFEVQNEAIDVCELAIQDFVNYVRVNEPDTILYISLQEKENPRRFLHYFIFRDENARELHYQFGRGEPLYGYSLPQSCRAGRVY